MRLGEQKFNYNCIELSLIRVVRKITLAWCSTILVNRSNYITSLSQRTLEFYLLYGDGMYSIWRNFLTFSWSNFFRGYKSLKQKKEKEHELMEVWKISLVNVMIVLILSSSTLHLHPYSHNSDSFLTPYLILFV